MEQNHRSSVRQGWFCTSHTVLVLCAHLCNPVEDDPEQLAWSAQRFDSLVLICLTKKGEKDACVEESNSDNKS